MNLKRGQVWKVVQPATEGYKEVTRYNLVIDPCDADKPLINVVNMSINPTSMEGTVQISGTDSYALCHRTYGAKRIEFSELVCEATPSEMALVDIALMRSMGIEIGAYHRLDEKPEKKADNSKIKHGLSRLIGMIAAAKVLCDDYLALTCILDEIIVAIENLIEED